MPKQKVSSQRTIQEGAIFISDAHYPHHGEAFLDILQRLERGEIQTPQLFLMGDNFDLLFGYNEPIQRYVSEAIRLLQTLSQHLEIHYFEGNHDFCLAPLFPHIHLYPRKEQPLYFQWNNKRVGLSHGDRYATGWVYHLYSRLLRNRRTLEWLKPFEGWIIPHRMKRLAQKEICHSFEGFSQRVEAILAEYEEVDCVIEGHFHQAKQEGKYYSLPSLACQGSVGVIEEGQLRFKVL